VQRVAGVSSGYTSQPKPHKKATHWWHFCLCDCFAGADRGKDRVFYWQIAAKVMQGKTENS
jgi:hypothetical protein